MKKLSKEAKHSKQAGADIGTVIFSVTTLMMTLAQAAKYSYDSYHDYQEKNKKIPKIEKKLVDDYNDIFNGRNEIFI